METILNCMWGRRNRIPGSLRNVNGMWEVTWNDALVSRWDDIGLKQLMAIGVFKLDNGMTFEQLQEHFKTA